MALPSNPETHSHLFTDNMRFVLKAIVMHPTENKFLIIKRSEKERIRPNTWDLPGGSVLYGELHIHALEREIFEETKLNVQKIRPVFISSDYNKIQPMYFLLAGFLCQATSDHIKLSDEHTEFKWITKADFMAIDTNYTFVENRPLNIFSTNFLRDIVSSSHIDTEE